MVVSRCSLNEILIKDNKKCSKKFAINIKIQAIKLKSFPNNLGYFSSINWLYLEKCLVSWRWKQEKLVFKHLKSYLPINVRPSVILIFILLFNHDWSSSFPVQAPAEIHVMHLNIVHNFSISSRYMYVDSNSRLHLLFCITQEKWQFHKTQLIENAIIWFK